MSDYWLGFVTALGCVVLFNILTIAGFWFYYKWINR